MGTSRQGMNSCGIQEALDLLRRGDENLSSFDTAGYEHDLLRYCEKGREPRFGRIEFAIGVDVTKSLRRRFAGSGGSGVETPCGKEVKGERRKTGADGPKSACSQCHCPSRTIRSIGISHP